jgi:hypothetical protein
VCWIDINLIANDRFVTVLLRFMSVHVLRESACDCVHEIICKGMDPAAKTALIESFTAVLKTAGVLRHIEEVINVCLHVEWCFLALKCCNSDGQSGQCN